MGVDNPPIPSAKVKKLCFAGIIRTVRMILKIKQVLQVVWGRVGPWAIS